MSKLGPILEGDDMKQCTTDSTFVIPHIGAYDRGYTTAPEQVCSSAACGKALGAIKELGMQECELAQPNRPGGDAISVTLFEQHVSKVFDLCGEDTTTYGKKPARDPSAMDGTKPCTQAAVASYFSDSRSNLEQCIGTSLKSLVSDDPAVSNGTADVVAEFSVCPACTNISAIVGSEVKQSEGTIPTCLLPGRGISFRDHLQYAFKYCEGLDQLAKGKTVNKELSSKVMNESCDCDFHSRSMRAYLMPVEKELFANEKCTSLLFNPKTALSESNKAEVCKLCPDAKSALAKMQVPLCKTCTGSSYKSFLEDALSKCEKSTNDPKQSTTTAAGDSSAGITISPSAQVALFWAAAVIAMGVM